MKTFKAFILVLKGIGKQFIWVIKKFISGLTSGKEGIAALAAIFIALFVPVLYGGGRGDDGYPTVVMLQKYLYWLGAVFLMGFLLKVSFGSSLKGVYKFLEDTYQNTEEWEKLPLSLRLWVSVILVAGFSIAFALLWTGV